MRPTLVVYHLVPTSNHNWWRLRAGRIPVVYHLVPTSNHNLGYQAVNTMEVVYHLVPTSNHNDTGSWNVVAEVVYHLVPTSNHNHSSIVLQLEMLFIILFLHQTTTPTLGNASLTRCLSSCSYIKPQLGRDSLFLGRVVYHLVPTSNHNSLAFYSETLLVVYHLVPTSNHNRLPLFLAKGELFIILFLHQTTTEFDGLGYQAVLFIILFLHQTTTCPPIPLPRCRLFIILFLHQTTTPRSLSNWMPGLFIILFLHQTTTLNGVVGGFTALFIILFLHQTTTYLDSVRPLPSCLSSCSYIKPQLLSSVFFCISVVYHLVPTSNHNTDDE